MPWKVISQMDLKIKMIEAWESGYFSIRSLSQKYGISRPTVYKWLTRYKDCGVDGLKEQSRVPKHCPNRTDGKILKLLIAEKLKNRKRGPRKVRAQLKRKHPELHLPAISTIGYWLKKEGLVEKRKKRLRVPPYTQPFCGCDAPNEVWSIDYKGQFKMENRKVCYPLTLSDNFSRFLLCCQGPWRVPDMNRHDVIWSPFFVNTDCLMPFAAIMEFLLPGRASEDSAG